jgi:hypothetical protein
VLPPFTIAVLFTVIVPSPVAAKLPPESVQSYTVEAFAGAMVAANDRKPPITKAVVLNSRMSSFPAF